MPTGRGLYPLLLLLWLFSRWAVADTAHVTDDAYINLRAPHQKNGAAATIVIRNAGGVRQGFVRFDLTAFPPGISVAQATLRMWVATIAEPGSIGVHAVLGRWDEATLMASNAPTIGAPVATLYVTAADVNRYVTVDVTPLVQEWLKGSRGNDGLALLPS
jgi:hypothetical protein